MSELNVYNESLEANQKHNEMNRIFEVSIYALEELKRQHDTLKEISIENLKTSSQRLLTLSFESLEKDVGPLKSYSLEGIKDKIKSIIEWIRKKLGEIMNWLKGLFKSREQREKERKRKEREEAEKKRKENYDKFQKHWEEISKTDITITGKDAIGYGAKKDISFIKWFENKDLKISIGVDENLYMDCIKMFEELSVICNEYASQSSPSYKEMCDKVISCFEKAGGKKEGDKWFFRVGNIFVLAEFCLYWENNRLNIKNQYKGLRYGDEGNIRHIQENDTITLRYGELLDDIGGLCNRMKSSVDEAYDASFKQLNELSERFKRYRDDDLISDAVGSTNDLTKCYQLVYTLSYFIHVYGVKSLDAIRDSVYDYGVDTIRDVWYIFKWKFENQNSGQEV